MKKILISTNMYKGSEFGQILPYLKRFPGQVGVEVFPMFHEECFEKNLRDAMPLLKEVPVSFHGPYYQAEHSAAEGTVEYARWSCLKRRFRMRKSFQANISFIITTTAASYRARRKTVSAFPVKIITP